ncbi:MAG: 3-oxoacyl-[acyl-carrier-protein] synthase III C-terminal domain-containing protein [Bryobacteraceae bacterium]|jgi:alkylresorcinol/alkylpyrone synthase
MRIVSAASAFPEHYYPQAVLTQAMADYWGDRLDQPGLLHRLHARSCVDGRFTSLALEEYPGLGAWGAANKAWLETAEKIGAQALERAAAMAGVDTQSIRALFAVSVTGIASPSLDAHLINKMNLNPNLRRVPIFGLGCVAGAAGIAMAADYVRAWPDRIAALLSVELCSLTIQRGDLSVANLISSGLFGDGAAAVLVAGSDCELPGPEIVATRSVFYPDTEDVMGWDISEEGFRIVLSPEVPNMARKHLRQNADTFLAEFGLTRADVGCWILHTGGPKVLEATQEALEIDERALAPTWDCLRRAGNLSSASVLMVLEEIMLHRKPPAGTWSVLAAMGPGFCSEMILLRW